MKVHIFQHTTDTPVGSTEEWLQKNNLKYSFTRFYEKEFKIPSLSDVDFLVVCGGEMNVDQEDNFPWLKEEKKFIKACIDSNKKVIGLCLGGQLIAEILGARVGKHPQWEVGWHPIELAKSEKFKVPQQPNPLMAFQFHGYSFDTPQGATQIASSAACAHQGFTYGSNVVGIQFHPESTKDWVIQCADEELPKGSYVQSKNEMREGNKYQAELQAWYFNLLNQFL